ncbi:MAG: SDR family NAD(P)-dependent oxidoreductase [Mizugakiibacter sp.]|uniref:SDR family NAD(P)-dependent oxidoreductase n=1 Tax=Mizugakiibacter sp. TaxID=1972610 RepID=UPI0031C26D7B|nr:SDR family NAD(P)-dependent oxidoreductase [Xanthomonadaceae bacterium]
MSLPTAYLPAGWTPAPGALDKRVVLVSGATGGLGEAAARACAAAGATVVLLGRRVPALEKVYDAIVASGAPEPAIYPVNLEGATPRDYDTLADVLERELGGVDAIVHAAAHFNALTPLELHKPEDWLRGLQVNLTAPFLLTQACMPLLKARADSAVVFVLDDPQRLARAHWGAYGVAKAGLERLAAILHEETDSSPLRVHALLPAPMRTTLRRMAYFGEDTQRHPQPDAVAPAVVYLLSRDGAAARGHVLDLRGA